MAKHIGAYATLALAASTGLTDHGRINADVRRLAHDYVTVDAAENDTVSLGLFDWDILLDDLSHLDFTDLGTSVTLDIGDVTYPAALVDGQDVATAAGSVKLLKSTAIDNRKKPLWGMLGYASKEAAKAVGARCELLASIKDANPASGTLAWSIYGSPQ